MFRADRSVKRRVPFDLATREHTLWARDADHPQARSVDALFAATTESDADLLLVVTHYHLYPHRGGRCSMLN